MGHSEAYTSFIANLSRAQALVSVEADHYGKPISNEDFEAIQGLRGASAVLMIAAFENYLRELFAERLSLLRDNARGVEFDNLPDAMRIHSVFSSLKTALDGPRHKPKRDKVDRLPDIVSACQVVVSRTISPEAFCDTAGNPNPTTLNSMFAKVGISDIVSRIHARFGSEWPTPIARNFIRDKLDEIVNRRHVVAHTASASSISQRDLQDAISFLTCLAGCLDDELDGHISSLMQTPEAIP